MQPDIILNGNKVGTSIPGSIIFVDVSPGKQKVTISAIMYPGESSINFEIQSSEVMYVKTWMGGSAFAGRTNVKLIGYEQANSEIDGLGYIGNPLKASSENSVK